MSFRALCPHCDVASQYSSEFRNQKLRCGNPGCGREFVPQFVVELPAEPARAPRRPSPVAHRPGTRRPAQARGTAKSGGDIPLARPVEAPLARPVAAPLAQPVKMIPCPRCGKPIEPNTVLCLSCGTNLETGRRYSGSKAWDKAKEQAALARGWLGVWSVFVPFGLVPYASEARLRLSGSARYFKRAVLIRFAFTAFRPVVEL